MNNEEIIIKNSNRLDQTTSLVDVLNLFKQSFKNELHVATIALFKGVVKEFDSDTGYGLINIIPLPLSKNENSRLQQCYYFKEENFIDDQIVTVIYTDLNFDVNLKTSKNNPIKNLNPSLHSKSSAVLVSTNSVQLGPKLLGVTKSDSNRFVFSNVDLVKNQGLGVFTFGYCNTLITLYRLNHDITYKTVGTFIYEEGELGSVVTTTINYKYNNDNHTLTIWSGNSNFSMSDNMYGYLFIVNL